METTSPTQQDCPCCVVPVTRIVRVPAGIEAEPEAPDTLVVEEPLEIRIDGRRYTATMRTPGQDERLALGLLLSEGVISSLADVERVDVGSRCRDLNGSLVNLVNVVLHEPVYLPAHQWERSLISNSSCGLCGKATIEALSARVNSLAAAPGPTVETLLELPAAMRAHQEVFSSTGGLHAAAIFRQNGQLLACHEDIGRHNAADKSLGQGLQEGWLPAREPLTLLISGRASFEIVQKALLAGVLTVAAVSAASSLAVELARANNLNLVGFVRQSSLNLYCGSLAPVG